MEVMLGRRPRSGTCGHNRLSGGARGGGGGATLKRLEFEQLTVAMPSRVVWQEQEAGQEGRGELPPPGGRWGRWGEHRAGEVLHGDHLTLPHHGGQPGGVAVTQDGVPGVSRVMVANPSPR